MNFLKINLIPLFLKCFLIGGVVLLSTHTAMSDEFFTNFEFTDTSGSFVQGTEPDTVLFSHGEAKSILISKNRQPKYFP